MKGNESVRKGFTVIEMLVYAALFGILMTCLYWSFNAVLRYFFIADCYVNVQQNALKAMTQLTRELSETDPSYVIIDTGTPGGIIFAYPKKITSTASVLVYEHLASGSLNWMGWICYYTAVNNGVNCLLRKEYASGGGTMPLCPAGYTTASGFAGDSSLKAKTVAHYVKSLIFTTITANGKTFIRINGSFERSPRPDRPNVVTMETEVRLRN